MEPRGYGGRQAAWRPAARVVYGSRRFKVRAASACVGVRRPAQASAFPGWARVECGWWQIVCLFYFCFYFYLHFHFFVFP